MLKKITKLAAKSIYLSIYIFIYFMLLPKQYFVRF